MPITTLDMKGKSMRLITTLLVGAATTSAAIAGEVTVPCTTVEIVQTDGTKRLNSVPKIDFLETLGKIDAGDYTGNQMTIHLLGSGEILCQLHENTNSDDSE